MHPSRPSSSKPALALLIAGLLAATACTGQRPTLTDDTNPSAEQSSTTTASDAGTERAEAARATGDEIAVYPDATTTEPTQTITTAEAAASPDVPITFLVKDRSGDRIEVYLPVEPPGSTGWVDAADVTVSAVDYRVELSLSGRWLRVRQLGEILLDEPIAVGTSDDVPEPGAIYYLKELLQPPDPSGPYGTYAYGLSGFRSSQSSFTTGEGIVGLHGTEDESSIGGELGSGSIALADEVLARMVSEIGLPLGTPVDVLP